MTATMKAVEKERAEVARLMAVEADFSRQLTRKQATAKGADLGTETLEAALSGDDKAATRAANKAAKAAAEVEALASAIVAARRGREATILRAWAAEAELRGQEAEKLRVTAGALQVKIDGLVARLKEESGVEYVPGPCAELLAVGRDVGLSQPLRYGIDAAPTQVDILKVRAATLDDEARELAAREVSRAGSVIGRDVAELFAAVCAMPTSIGPTLDELRGWVEVAEAAAREKWQAPRWRDHVPADDAAWEQADKTFTVLWRVGRIVPGESSCKVVQGVVPDDPSWFPGAEQRV